MNICVVKADSNELVAYASDEHENIIMNGYNIINFGENEPILHEVDGKVCVKDNAFGIRLKP